MSNFKHSGYGTRIHRIWYHMKGRCLNINDKKYKNYGGRGITICNEWLNFIPFRDWSLANGYQKNLQINRINNDGNYEPTNCNFITRTENMRNTRHCKIKNMEQANEIRALYNTGDYTQKELGNKYAIHQTTISYIVNTKLWKNKI